VLIQEEEEEHEEKEQEHYGSDPYEFDLHGAARNGGGGGVVRSFGVCECVFVCV